MFGECFALHCLTEHWIASFQDLGSVLLSKLLQPERTLVSQIDVQQALLHRPYSGWLVAELIKLYEFVGFIISANDRDAAVGPSSAKCGHIVSSSRCNVTDEGCGFQLPPRCYASSVRSPVPSLKVLQGWKHGFEGCNEL